MATLQEVKTQQDVLNYVAPLLLKQGEKSLFGDLNPQQNYANAYRGSGGKKCAIGHLIPDDEYEPRMEGQPVDLLLSRFAVPTLRKIEDETGLDFLWSLQKIHDQYEPAVWAEKLNDLANLFRLAPVQV